MAPGIRRCMNCEGFFSVDEWARHNCILDTDPAYTEKINYIHCLFQEMEDKNINLPMGDYNLVYDVLEEIRDLLEVGSMTRVDISKNFVV